MNSVLHPLSDDEIPVSTIQDEGTDECKNASFKVVDDPLEESLIIGTFSYYIDELNTDYSLRPPSDVNEIQYLDQALLFNVFNYYQYEQKVNQLSYIF